MDSDVRGPEGVELPTENRSGVVRAVVSTLIPLAALVVGLRFYARHHLDRWVGIDDWAVLAAFVFTVGLGITICLMAEVGLGQHLWDLSESQIEQYFKRFYFTVILYYCALGSIKNALLLQYRRIFGSKLRRPINIALLVIGSWSIGLVLVSIFTCHPISGYWIKDVKATCIPTYQWYIHSAGNILSDLVIFTLPIPVLWNMKVSMRQRLLLILVFSLGLLNCSISGIRIKYLPIVNRNPDVTYDNLDAAAWTMGEVCLAIICACLPTLRPIYARAARQRFTDSLGPGLRRRKAAYYGGPGRDLLTPTEGVSSSTGIMSRRDHQNIDIEKLASPRATPKLSSIDTSSDCTRTGIYQSQSQSSRAPSQCDHHCYELVESPPLVQQHPERKLPRPRVARVPGALTSPCQPPEHRRPSVQSILDEIVVTQPPSAIIHEALGSNFPIRVAGHVEPLGASRGRFSSIDTVASEGLSPPRPRIRRMASEGSAAPHVSHLTSPTWRDPGSAARMPADFFNRVDFQVVGWGSGSASRSPREVGHAPRDLV
ncbi:hypothetical protein KVR01_003974 [Diaporthe batatas]|uniref:uncharacterized protein n=1 Tax=Diaporthe batatas TaxID=748121 RepID=UPI001D039450|nr:uncharacterized protein KVR01_003974 [Diaporthe batatas]KAG8168285.1 hypothetical protein KVR01_003974 [Diaporthe batatas]